MADTDTGPLGDAARAVNPLRGSTVEYQTVFAVCKMVIHLTRALIGALDNIAEAIREGHTK